MPPWFSYASPTLPDRFWRRVDDSGGPDACWLWKGATRNGYGQMSVGGRTVEYTHRVSWLLHGNELPPLPAVLLHSCDVRACCNPAHLRIGTMADNHRDCLERGRSDKPPGFGQGRRNSRAKLSESDIRPIRVARRQGATITELARRYGMGWTAIYDIVNGNNWRHVE